jgi:DNA-binding NarL/FixJ family response regulator
LTGRPTVLLADRAPVRRGIRMALDSQADVCAEAETPEQAIRAAKREQPDICLISRELCGPEMANLRGICRAAPHTSAVVLATAPDEDDLLDSIRAGAVGYVPNGLDAPRLRRIVQAVTANEAIIPRSMVREVVMELQGASGGAEGLTGREAQVLGLLRRGHSTAMIAARLHIAPVTVRRYVSELVHKLGVADRHDLVQTSSLAGHRSESQRAGR